jgi:hypothetical protein
MATPFQLAAQLERPKRQKTAHLRLDTSVRYAWGRASGTCGLATAPSPYQHGDSQVTESDPTDHALAAIASILDKPETSEEQNPGSTPESKTTDQPEFRLAEEILTTAPAAAPPSAPAPPSTLTDADSFTEADNYTKFGPGPLAAVRFKWIARRDDNGDYFVDETIGENSHPLVNGPMTSEAAISFVDDRERDARQRFEALRSEMAGGEIGRSGDDPS